ncbi:MAG: DNA-deoxyinosine glycosylase [Oscillospiraceae bacterium]
MELRKGQKGFAPVYTPAARALILGTYPSPKSFAQGFYYGHPQNRFWPLLTSLAGAPVPVSIQEKTALVTGGGLALWDTLESCEITGAADSSIQNPVPNNIAWLLGQTNIEAVFCNGAAAYHFYGKFCLAQTGLAAQRLPSTSPANAAFSLPRLREAWQPLAHYIEKRNET